MFWRIKKFEERREYGEKFAPKTEAEDQCFHMLSGFDVQRKNKHTGGKRQRVRGRERTMMTMRMMTLMGLTSNGPVT